MSEPTYGIRPPTDFTRLLDVLRQYRIIGFVEILTVLLVPQLDDAKPPAIPAEQLRDDRVGNAKSGAPTVVDIRILGQHRE